MLFDTPPPPTPLSLRMCYTSGETTWDCEFDTSDGTLSVRVIPDGQTFRVEEVHFFQD
jgi:hypothetical protein